MPGCACFAGLAGQTKPPGPETPAGTWLLRPAPSWYWSGIDNHGYRRPQVVYPAAGTGFTGGYRRGFLVVLDWSVEVLTLTVDQHIQDDHA